QLAQVLALELTQKRDYVQMLLEAHRQMATLSEELAQTRSQERRASAQLLSQTQELSRAIECWNSGDDSAAVPAAGEPTCRASNRMKSGNEPFERFSELEILARKLASFAARCRERRQELSLLLLEPNAPDFHVAADVVPAYIHSALE